MLHSFPNWDVSIHRLCKWLKHNHLMESRTPRLLCSPFLPVLADTPDTRSGMLGQQLPESSHCLPVSLPTVSHTGTQPYPAADSHSTEPETVALHRWDAEITRLLLHMGLLCQLIHTEQDLGTGYHKGSQKQRAPSSPWAPEPNIHSAESASYPESLQGSCSKPVLNPGLGVSASSCSRVLHLVPGCPLSVKPEHPWPRVTGDITNPFQQAHIFR